MTETGTFRTDRTALSACAEALAVHGLWAPAARFGERAVPLRDPDYDQAVRVAWLLLRAGRAREAAERLAVLPDDAHAELWALRLTAAGLSEPDTAAARLSELRTELAGRTPTPTGLRLMAMLARAGGEANTALVAARRYLSDVDSEDPDMRRLLAVDQATRGQLTEAVASTECVLAGHIGEPNTPLHEIAEDVAATDRPLTALRYLAEGYLKVGRRGYAEVLLARLPLRARQRNRIVGLSVSAIVLGVGLMVAGTGPLLGVGTPLALVGAIVAGWAVFLRVPGASRAQTNQIMTARARYQTSLGLPDAVSAVAGAAAGGFTAAVMFARGDGGPIPPTALIVAACLGVGAALTAGCAVAVLRRRARSTKPDEPVSAQPCRCWELSAFTGPRWRTYLTEHLAADGAQRSLDAEQRHCPETGKVWLCLTPSGPAVSLSIPEEPPVSPGYL